MVLRHLEKCTERFVVIFVILYQCRINFFTFQKVEGGNKYILYGHMLQNLEYEHVGDDRRIVIVLTMCDVHICIPFMRDLWFFDRIYINHGR